MTRVIIVSFLVSVVMLGCKSRKAGSTYVSPHTDTINITVAYQEDSVELYVQKIIKNDSLFNLKAGVIDFMIQAAEQKDSILFFTVKSFNGCKKMDFKVYQHSFVFKSSPPRLRMRLAKTVQSKCSEADNGTISIFTVACDVRDILNQYEEATIVFTNPSKVVRLKK